MKDIKIESITFTQEPDCCSDLRYGVQRLNVDLMDGGGGSYLVLRTDKWAIDVDDLKLFRFIFALCKRNDRIEARREKSQCSTK